MLAFPKYGDLAASTRQRFLQYAPLLAEAGIDLDVSPLLGNAHLQGIVAGKRSSTSETMRAYAARLLKLDGTRAYDLLWVHCELFPYMPALLERLAFATRKPVVYDYDDAIFEMYDGSDNFWIRRLLGGKLEPLLSGAAACACGNEHLRRYAARFCSNSIILPTVVDTSAYRPCAGPNSDGAPVIGWIGSPSTWPYVEQMLPILTELGARIRIVGAGSKAVSPHPLVDFITWSEATEVQELQAMDIGIMPLPDDRWARGKSGYKLIQYMACGLPTVASPVGVNSEIVLDGETGFLAQSPEEWREALRRLIAHASLRKRLGAAGRERAERHYSLAVHAPRLVSLFKSVVSGERFAG